MGGTAETVGMTEQGQFPGLPPTVERIAEEPLAVGKPRLMRAQREQKRWLVASLDELLAQDHPARAVLAFVEGLDLSMLNEGVRAVEGRAGRPAIDPGVLLSLWLYGMSKGVSSARELDRLCDEHDAYRWLAGGVSVNYHTLSDFRNQGAAFDRLLTGMLAALTKEGILQLERVAQDGMRTRASAGAASFHGRTTLEAHRKAAEAQLKWLKEQAESGQSSLSARQQKAQERAARERQERVQRALKLLPEAEKKVKQRKDKEPGVARVSSTDPQARVMKMADGGFRPAYNAQMVSDAETQLIVAVDVVNLGSDMAQLPPLLTQLECRLGRLPREVLVDGGYASEGSIEDAHRRGVALYAPIQKPKDALRNRYLPLPGDSPARARLRLRMGTAEAKVIYKERASTAECVNANLRRFGLRCFPYGDSKRPEPCSHSPPSPTTSFAHTPSASPLPLRCEALNDPKQPPLPSSSVLDRHPYHAMRGPRPSHAPRATTPSPARPFVHTLSELQNSQPTCPHPSTTRSTAPARWYSRGSRA